MGYDDRGPYYNQQPGAYPGNYPPNQGYPPQQGYPQPGYNQPQVVVVEQRRQGGNSDGCCAGILAGLCCGCCAFECCDCLMNCCCDC
ncbi:unnamed protein product, partial [Mesorhabditis spiculigera]